MTTNRMTSAEDVRVYIEEILQDAYQRPHLFGVSPIEVDAQLRLLHWIWGSITDRREELNSITLEVTPAGYSSVAGSFYRLFDLVHRSKGDERERMAFIVDKWRTISDRLGIAINGG